MPSLPLIIDSAFAENLNTKGNRCSISFAPPLQIPRGSSPRLRLYSSSFAYNSPNVDSSNNQLIINRTTGGQTKTITFATGLYGTLGDIALHADANYNQLEISLIGVAATQRVHLEVKKQCNDTVTFSFTSGSSIGPLMGFNQDAVFPANFTTSRESDTTAALDRTTSILIQTSLCSGSVVRGQGGSSTLAMVHLGGEVPSSVVSYQPDNMLEVPAMQLAGGTMTSATFALINQSGEDVGTLGGKWQLVIEVVW